MFPIIPNRNKKYKLMTYKLGYVYEYSSACDIIQRKSLNAQYRHKKWQQHTIHKR
jgi:hypothetical protein